MVSLKDNCFLLLKIIVFMLIRLNNYQFKKLIFGRLNCICIHHFEYVNILGRLVTRFVGIKINISCFILQEKLLKTQFLIYMTMMINLILINEHHYFLFLVFH